MSVRPHITLLFLLTAMTILLVVAAFFPENGIKIGNQVTIHFISLNEIFRPDHDEYVDISKIIANNSAINDSILSKLSVDEKTADSDTVRADIAKLKKNIARLQFPENKPDLLYSFFKSLDLASIAKNPVRIMHYGDSQIEGDRITSYIRSNLQKKFGGSGVGLIPVQHLYDFGFSTSQTSSDNWYRYTLYGTPDTSVKHRRYGVLAGFCRFTDNANTEINNDTSVTEAWVAFSPSVYSYSNTKTFRQCRVFYSHNKKPFMAELYLNNKIYDAEIYPACNSLQTIRWIFDQPASQIKIIFKGTQSPDIYGIALDDVSGVAVDNIAMRGSSGLIFTKSDRYLLQNFYNKLNVNLILLQFGGNVVPFLTNSSSYYEKLFNAQLKRLKEIAPNAVIIVIGVADMSIKEKNKYVSYPNIEKIRDAMKKATFNNHCVYWDMYEAMGGKNSMPSWVFAKPSLASKDFVHFNATGARIIAQMFYNALMYEYNLYENSTLEKTENK